MLAIWHPTDVWLVRDQCQQAFIGALHIDNRDAPCLIGFTGVESGPVRGEGDQTAIGRPLWFAFVEAGLRKLANVFPVGIFDEYLALLAVAGDRAESVQTAVWRPTACWTLHQIVVSGGGFDVHASNLNHIAFTIGRQNKGDGDIAFGGQSQGKHRNLRSIPRPVNVRVIPTHRLCGAVNRLIKGAAVEQEENSPCRHNQHDRYHDQHTTPHITSLPGTLTRSILSQERLSYLPYLQRRSAVPGCWSCCVR